MESQAPEFAGMMRAVRHPPISSVGGNPEKLASLELWLEATDADIKRAQIAYKTRWLQAERAHPILVTYRAAPGRDVDLSALIGENDDQQMLGVLRDVLPKLANIGKAGSWLKTGHLAPLELPPVVELAKQRMLIVPGGMRDRVVNDMVEDANDGDWKEWAIVAVTLGMAVLSAVPSSGSSHRVIGRTRRIGS